MTEPLGVGGCQCGAVEYEYAGDPLTCFACHCTDCQTASGSAFSMSLVVYREDLQVRRGRLMEDSFHLNGNDLIRTGCEACGTGLWYSGTEMPAIIALKPGTFNNTSWVEPVAHVWTRSRQSWLLLDSSIPCFETQPDITELLELWKRKYPVDTPEEA